MKRNTQISLAIYFLAMARKVGAQTRATTADLAETILDQSSAVLPGATVTAQNNQTNLSRSSLTDASGRFLIPALSPGAYSVRAALPGFTPRTLSDVVL